jgi:hypothetical protein
MHSSCKLRVRGEIARRTKQHDRMSVMPAHMGDTATGRYVWNTRLLDNRKRIHIGAKSNASNTGAISHYGSHYSGSTDSLRNMHTPFSELLRDNPCRSVFLTTKFGMSMEVPSNVSQLGVSDGRLVNTQGAVAPR